MRRSFLIRPFGWAFTGLWLCACSLSLEDPEEDARRKLEKTIPTAFAALEGRWIADSTFTAEATRAHLFSGNELRLDIYADTTLSAFDASRIVFPGGLSGRYSLSGDTLVHHPAGSVVRDTFTVKLRFLGNWLDLLRHADQRHIRFHKLKPPDSAFLADSLDNTFWLLEGRSAAPGFPVPEPLRRDFSYLRFSGGILAWEWRRNGLDSSDSGPLTRNGRNWVWSAGQGNRSFLADMVDKDTLRLWSLTGSRPDSGYRIFRRTALRHPHDLDMRPWLGHMRTDSMGLGGKIIDNHYGRYYDLAFGTDHSIRIETNMPDMPSLLSWSLDSGYLRVDAAPEKNIRLRADTLIGGVVRLTADSGMAFSRRTVLYQTKVDPSLFAENPLERFDGVAYGLITIGQDTLRYFFNAKYARGVLDEFEIAEVNGADTAWLVLKSDRARETFVSNQPGFRFAFAGRGQEMGRFVCVSIPTLDLAVRLSAKPDAALSQGLLQGSCKVVSADIAPSDSVLGFEGSFRFRRVPGGALLSPLWRLP